MDNQNEGDEGGRQVVKFPQAGPGCRLPHLALAAPFSFFFFHKQRFDSQSLSAPTPTITATMEEVEGVD